MPISKAKIMVKTIFASDNIFENSASMGCCSRAINTVLATIHRVIMRSRNGSFFKFEQIFNFKKGYLGG